MIYLSVMNNKQKTQDIREKLTEFLSKQVAINSFSGSVLMVKDGNSFLEYSSGYTNKEKRTKNEIDTLFNIGSMGKMFTGVAIAQLVEKGKISFQDYIAKYLPNYPKEIAEKVSIHHLLTHTGGMDHYLNKKYIEIHLQLASVNDYLSLFIDKPLLFTPGEKYYYSNAGYVVLGAIIEAATGQLYEEYITQHIYHAAGMDNTKLVNIHDENPHIAHGYTFRLPYSHEVGQERRDNSTELPLRGSSAGGEYSTCYDLLKFSQALLQNKLLSQEMTKTVLTPHVTVASKEGKTLYYGYGFQMLDCGDSHYRYGHAGLFPGVNTRLDMYPDFGYTVAVLCNYDEPSAFAVANEAMKLIISK